MEQLQSQTDLMQVVLALHRPGGFTCSLDCWKQQPNKNPNDRNDDQKLHQSECPSGQRISSLQHEISFFNN
jgi:hypothetical protein